MSTSFQVRKTIFGKYNGVSSEDVKVYVEPNKVIFQECTGEENYISKIYLHNESLKLIECIIQQPKKSSLKVRMRKNIVQANQQVEIFVILNCSQFSNSIQDEFAIYIGNQAIHVPIKVRAKEIHLMRSGIKIETKENLNETKKKINRFRSSKKLTKNDKRKHAAFIVNTVENKKIDQYIKEFITKFDKIEDELRDKSISNENFIGEKSLPEQNYYLISFFNKRVIFLSEERQKESILSRFKTQFREEGPVICQLDVYPKLPRWNAKRNIPSITFNKGMRKFQEQVRKLIISYRFQKINKIRKIYQRFQFEQKMNKNQEKMIKKRNSIDFSIDENYGYKSSKIVIEELQDDSDNEGTRKHEYFCRKIEHIIENKNENKSTFQFNKFTLTPRFLEIDYQDERQYAKGHEFQIEARIGFDNWVTIEQINKKSIEIMKYSQVQLFHEWDFHVKTKDIEQSRKGQEIQYLRNIPVKYEKQKAITLFNIYSQNPVFKGHNLINSPTSYKNLRPFQLQFNFEEEEDHHLQKITFHQNSRLTYYIENFKQEFFPQFTPDNTSLYERLCDEKKRKIISKIDRDDRLKIERIIEYGGNWNYIQPRSNKIMESYSENNEEYIKSKRENDTEDMKHHKTLYNIKKIRIKQMNQIDIHIASYNKFIKKKANLVYF